MNKARLESYKYPHQPRYFFDTSVVKDSPELLMLYTVPGIEVFSGKHNATFPTTKHDLSLLWPGHFYNVILFWEADWTFETYYVNLAMPHHWDGKRCEYVDLELDIALTRNGAIKILDEDEYEESRNKYFYPEKLVTQIERATEEVVDLMSRRAFPFDDSLLDWRPEAA